MTTQETKGDGSAVLSSVELGGALGCTCSAKNMPFGRCCKREALDELLDHIYEYGTASEGVSTLADKLCNAARKDERETCDALRVMARRAIDAWDSTVLPRSRDGMMQERMEDLRATLSANK